MSERVSGWLYLALLSFLLIGAGNVSWLWHRIPIEQRTLVDLIAIDRGANDQYTVTASVVNLSGLAKPGASPTGQIPPVLIRKATAPSIDSALYEMMSYTSEHLDFSHLQGLFVSETLAEEGLFPILDSLSRSPEFRGTAVLAITRGMSSNSLLEASQRFQPRPGDVWSRTVSWARLHTPFVGTSLSDFFRVVPEEGQSPTVVGVRTAAPNLVGGKDLATGSFQLNGLALFRRDKLMGWFTKQQALGWMFLTGRIRHHPIDLFRGGATVQANSARVSVHVVGPSPRLDVTIFVQGELTKAVQPPFSINSSADPFKPFEHEMELEVSTAAYAALNRAKELGVDPFGLGEQVRFMAPKLWRQIGSKWEDKGFQDASISIHVRAAITSSGETVLPLR